MAATTIPPKFNPSSMADSSLLSFPSIFPSKSPYPHLQFPSKPIKLHLSSSHSLSLKQKSHHPLTISFATQTSDWAQQEEGNDTVAVEEEPKWENESEEWEGEGKDDDVDENENEIVEPPEEAKLFVGNLPYDVDSEKLAMLFEQAGIVEISEVIYNRDTDQSRGFGFVTMNTVEQAEKAVEMFHGYDVGGRLLTVNKAAPRGSQPERTSRAFAPSFKIYIGNLPWSVDNSRLEQVFSEHGKVVDVRVVYDRETGRSRGFGFVTMSDETEMNDAIAALDGQSLDGRAIRVNAAEDKPRRSF